MQEYMAWLYSCNTCCAEVIPLPWNPKGDVFNIGTKTADKASGRFFLSVLKILRLRSVR
ncbi:hypothetical protein VP01_6759g2 [Puccinia sorghi]|uniref:Uncharacterized protein n=1 Tax=Puccinia sorghi TaxID=27349 RepID=A0A0L6UEP2_9BASI|nr:hypothetical protein VP01_6759g2 [Puccinia sorghi]